MLASKQTKNHDMHFPTCNNEGMKGMKTQHVAFNYWGTTEGCESDAAKDRQQYWASTSERCSVFSSSSRHEAKSRVKCKCCVQEEGRTWKCRACDVSLCLVVDSYSFLKWTPIVLTIVVQKRRGTQLCCFLNLHIIIINCDRGPSLNICTMLSEQYSLCTSNTSHC